ncbi:pseudouridine synthase [Vulcanisaeta distributa]|uniref:tRNA pseudouridine(55) synthase TruB n=1 Tax=Vulcanisaeta distributa TaxID=164451 RepID=UPI0006CFC8E3|nr:tRNA pseudouridine(55) synthase TruB [Vulcanisaeta distributa]
MDQLTRDIIRGVLSYIYGPSILKRLNGELKIEVSRTGGLRRIYLGDELIFTIRASDGRPLPTLEGARLIDKVVIVSREAAPFVKQGRSVMARFVIDVRNAVPGDEVAIYSEDGEFLGVGRLLLSKDEVLSVGRGVVVKLRHHVGTSEVK